MRILYKKIHTLMQYPEMFLWLQACLFVYLFIYFLISSTSMNPLKGDDTCIVILWYLPIGHIYKAMIALSVIVVGITRNRKGPRYEEGSMVN